MKLLRSIHPAKRAKPSTRTKSGGADKGLVLAILGLLGFGIIMVYDSSVAIAIRDFADPYYFVKEQVKWLVLGVIAFFITSNVPYQRLRTVAVPLLVVTLVLLVAVFIPGFGVRALGAKRWLNFGLFILQPAELAKFSLIIYLSTWLQRKEENRLTAFVLLVAMVAGLVVIEPDLGTAIIIVAISLIMYFLSGAPLMHFAMLVPPLLLLVTLLIFVAPYRLARLTSFLDPDRDPLGSSYQIKQVLLSLGSGGVFGVGVGKSKQKYMYLPEANTDSIFAIIGEEVGFLGALILMATFLFVIWRGFMIAIRSPDAFGRLLVLGFMSWFAIQVVINLSAMVALVPITGVPLPLISYGGSSLIILLASLGIVINVSKQQSNGRNI